MFSAVIVDATRKPYREIQRDSRDPQEQPAEFERMANNYSRDGKLVHVYLVGRYVKPWRQQASPEYESRDGRATPDYRVISA